MQHDDVDKISASNRFHLVRRPGLVSALLAAFVVLALLGIFGITAITGRFFAALLGGTLLLSAGAAILIEVALRDLRAPSTSAADVPAALEVGARWQRVVTIRTQPHRLRWIFRSLRLTFAVADASSLPGLTLGALITAEPDGTANWICNVVPDQAGVFRIGPTHARLIGVWGLFSRPWLLHPAQEIVIRPPAISLRRCVLGRPSETAGVLPTPNAPERPPEFVGIRPYRPGDRISLIAWGPSLRSLATNGPLVSRQFASSAARTLWILGDFDGARYDLDGLPVQAAPLTAEVADLLRVVICSVALFYLAGGYDVGLLVSGAVPGMVSPGGESVQQRSAIQDALAYASTGAQRTQQRRHERELLAAAWAAINEFESDAARTLALIGGVFPEAAADEAMESQSASLDQLLRRDAAIKRGHLCALVTPHPPSMRQQTLTNLRVRGARTWIAAIGSAGDQWRRQADVGIPTSLARPDERTALIAVLEGGGSRL